MNPNNDKVIFENNVFQNFKIVLPRAPVRYVTMLKKENISWFDLKFRG